MNRTESNENLTDAFICQFFSRLSSTQQSSLLIADYYTEEKKWWRIETISRLFLIHWLKLNSKLMNQWVRDIRNGFTRNVSKSGKWTKDLILFQTRRIQQEVLTRFPLPLKIKINQIWSYTFFIQKMQLEGKFSSFRLSEQIIRIVRKSWRRL